MLVYPLKILLMCNVLIRTALMHKDLIDSYSDVAESWILDAAPLWRSERNSEKKKADVYFKRKLKNSKCSVDRGPDTGVILDDSLHCIELKSLRLLGTVVRVLQMEDISLCITLRLLQSQHWISGAIYINIPLLSPAVAPLGSFIVKATEKSVFLAEGCASNLISSCVCSSLTCTGMFAA